MNISKTAAQRLIVVTVACAIFSTPIITLAHCDGLDGPVVKAARKALETNKVNLVLIWVQKKDETEIKKSFQNTQAVRKASQEACRHAFF